MYLRLESLRLTVVGRRTPASTNLVVYCWRVLFWFCRPSISKISCVVRGVSSQNSNTFRCFAVKRTWLLLGSAWLLFLSAWLLFLAALLLFHRGLLLFPAALLLFHRGLTLFLHDRRWYGSLPSVGIPVCTLLMNSLISAICTQICCKITTIF